MDAINASSRQIADSIGTIDGIAFQTRILALNAAVEAAPAGEQGPGFAVVADMIGEINRATDGQSAGLLSVNRSVSELDAMTQQNAALVEEGAAAAESLRQQALRLSEVVQVFVVSGRPAAT